MKNLVDVFELVFRLGAFMALVGAMMHSIEAVAAGTFLAGLAFFVRDYVDPAAESLTPMSVYMLAAGMWFGLGNLVGYYAAGSQYGPRFALLRVDEHLFKAQLIGSAALFLPPISFRLLPADLRLPAVGFTSKEGPFQTVIALVVIAWAVRLAEYSVVSLGTLGTIIVLGPNLAIFILASQWAAGRGLRGSWKLLLAAIVISETSYALAFSYLRSATFWPSVVLLAPFVIGRKVGLRGAAATLSIAAVFLVLIGPMGDARSGQLYGRQRLDQVLAGTKPNSDGLVEGAMIVMARISTATQLTQICRLVAEDGFYGGETVRYAAFVLIPRVIWPSKPMIAPGQWFAQRLGRGQWLPSGRFSSAINMTVPGELYLNFGWTGVVLGLLGFGALLRVVWDASAFDFPSSNPIGLLLTFVLFAQVMEVGSHLGAVANVVIWYLMAFALTVGIGWFRTAPYAHPGVSH